MKKQQGFRWEKSIEKQRNKERWMENLVSALAVIGFDVLCALIFLHSAKHMLEMVYADLEYSSEFAIHALWLFLLSGLVVGTTQYIRRIPAFFIRWGIFLTGTYAVVRWVLKEEVWEKLCSGFWQVAMVYLDSWNEYYGSAWYCPAGEKEVVAYFVETVLLTALVLLFWLAKLCGKTYCMAAVPLLLFAAGLLVGNDPSEKVFCIYLPALCCPAEGIRPCRISAHLRKNAEDVLVRCSIWHG